ncbi:MAG: DNA recombination protein RmuC [Alphaproteobacteria bacterium]|nr:DNA recombination protein RmuC [Alphaproteobacteria bacterium]
MNTILLIAVLIGVLGVAVLLAALYLTTHRNTGNTEATGALKASEMAIRLSQMTEAQAAQQAQLAQTLQAQERALAKAVDDRLQLLTGKIDATLEKSTKTQKTSLDELKERLVRIDTAQKSLADLSSQVVGLQDILSNKQARGAFGEVQLQDLVESAMPPDTYTFQATIGDGKRADCLLDLPNPPGPMVVDAKFPLEAWRALQGAKSETQKKQAERAFRRDIAVHVKAISEKYIVPGETADAALMFLPSEAVYAELHANFGDSVDAAHRAKVFIVSPTTLWALLNTMRAVMKDVRMKEAASIIQTEVLTMLEDVDRLDKRVGHLEKHFQLAEKDIKDIRTSANRVKRRGDKIHNIQLDDGTEASAVEDTLGEPPLLRGVE